MVVLTVLLVLASAAILESPTLCALVLISIASFLGSGVLLFTVIVSYITFKYEKFIDGPLYKNHSSF